MTRSEVVEMLVDEAMLNCERFASLGDFDGSEIERVMLNTELDILLAEQKRSEGCAVCRGEQNMVSDNEMWDAVRFVNGEMQVRNASEYGWTRVKATHCPNCGRDLTEDESV